MEMAVPMVEAASSSGPARMVYSMVTEPPSGSFGITANVPFT